MGQVAHIPLARLSHVATYHCKTESSGEPGRREERGFLVSREQHLPLGPFPLCQRFSSFFSHLMCEEEPQGLCSCEKR